MSNGIEAKEKEQFATGLSGKTILTKIFLPHRLTFCLFVLADCVALCPLHRLVAADNLNSGKKRDRD